MSSRPITVAIAIITYRRPQNLKRLLETLSAQQLTSPDSFAVRIVVVQNEAEQMFPLGEDPGEHAEPVHLVQGLVDAGRRSQDAEHELGHLRVLALLGTDQTRVRADELGEAGGEPNVVALRIDEDPDELERVLLEELSVGHVQLAPHEPDVRADRARHHAPDEAV